ncbi:MAG TPA: thiamine phosphate synthase [Verrucomicrobiae bacterium]|nr:thiamine phosphate synthase [Verrucomicrobiae bacterium]
MKTLSDCRLYTFVDTAYLRAHSPEFVAQELCDGGSDLIQLRAKNSSVEETRRIAEEIVPITGHAGVGLVINDHPRIAIEVGAEFCHLGQEDLETAELGNHPNRFGQIGLSTHAPEQAQRAIALRPAYIAIGPVYATGTKPNARPVTLDYVRWASANVTIPWFAIGGINLTNIDDVLAAGAKRICVVSAILSAPDIAAACRQFKERLG